MFTECHHCGDTITEDETGRDCSRNEGGHQPCGDWCSA